MKLLASLGWQLALLAAIATLFGIFLLAIAVEALSKPWRKRRQRERDMARFSLNAFKPVNRNWWEA